MIDFQELIKACESDLRGGQSHLVTSRLSAVRLSEIPQAHRLALANICRRAGLLATGLKILSVSMSRTPSSGELAEYAVLLERSGAVKEALSTLARVDTSTTPEAFLYRAFCHFKSWDYVEAIPELKAYIAQAATPYSGLVGRVNLAAAYIVDGRDLHALDLLTGNIAMAEENSFDRLRGNCFELQAQVHFFSRRFKMARESLNQAAAIFSQEKSFDQFFVRKWQTILTAFEQKDSTNLKLLRDEALKRRDWETVREADLFSLQIKFDVKDFNRLYFGTPFLSYRKRIEKLLQRQPSSDRFNYGDLGGRAFDLATARFNDGTSATAGKLNHRLLAVLLRDLYRPLHIGGIFAEVFPEERFDIYSSPGRIHHLQFRTRQWLRENRIGAELVEDKKTYSMRTQTGFAFSLSLSENEVAGWLPYWNILKSSESKVEHFTAAEVRDALSLKSSSCKRFLKWAIDSGRLVRNGDNNRSYYSLA